MWDRWWLTVGVSDCFWSDLAQREPALEKRFGLFGEGGRSALLRQSWALGHCVDFPLRTRQLKPVPLWLGQEWALLLIQPMEVLVFCPSLVRMQQLPGGEWVKRHDLKFVLLAAGVQRNETEVAGIITVGDLLCGSGLKASCFLSWS